MINPVDTEKRKWIKVAAVTGAAIAGGLVLPSTMAAKDKSRKRNTRKEQAEVTPPEDLMREHGVLERLLLVYEAGIRKFASN